MSWASSTIVRLSSGARRAHRCEVWSVDGGAELRVYVSDVLTYREPVGERNMLDRAAEFTRGRTDRDSRARIELVRRLELRRTIPARMNETPQREFWNGRSVQLNTLWTLSKRGKVAACALLTHQLGRELRVESDDLLLTQVCRSDREIEEVSAGWRHAMLAKGWTYSGDRST
jgi:hypothetical protein